jgi:hypothetical protein
MGIELLALLSTVGFSVIGIAMKLVSKLEYLALCVARLEVRVENLEDKEKDHNHGHNSPRQ